MGTLIIGLDLEEAAATKNARGSAEPPDVMWPIRPVTCPCSLGWPYRFHSFTILIVERMLSKVPLQRIRENGGVWGLEFSPVQKRRKSLVGSGLGCGTNRHSYERRADTVLVCAEPKGSDLFDENWVECLVQRCLR